MRPSPSTPSTDISDLVAGVSGYPGDSPICAFTDALIAAGASGELRRVCAAVDKISAVVPANCGITVRCGDARAFDHGASARLLRITASAEGQCDDRWAEIEAEAWVRSTGGYDVRAELDVFPAEGLGREYRTGAVLISTGRDRSTRHLYRGRVENWLSRAERRALQDALVNVTPTGGVAPPEPSEELAKYNSSRWLMSALQDLLNAWQRHLLAKTVREMSPGDSWSW